MKPFVAQRWLFFLLLVMSGLGQPLFASRTAPQTDLQKLLVESYEADFEPTVLRSEIVALGDSAAGELLEILSRGSFQSGGAPIEYRYELMILSLLSSWPGTAANDAIVALVGSDAEPNERVAAMKVLAHRSKSRDLQLLVDLGPKNSGQPIIERSVQQGFELALNKFAARNSSLETPLAQIARRAHPSLLQAILEQIADSQASNRLDLLAGLLGWLSDAEELVLFEMQRSMHDGFAPPSPNRLAELREFLRSSKVESAMLAAAVLGKLRDHESIPDLIEMLRSEHSRARASAVNALQIITGLHYGDDLATWAFWYEVELDWHNGQSEVVFRSVISGNAAEAAKAIREISSHRLFTDELVKALLPALSRDEAQLVYLACGALSQMHSSLGLSALAACLDHNDETVRQMAWTALKRLTNRNLPPDRWIWEDRVIAPRLSSN